MAMPGDAKSLSFVEDTAVAPERLRDYIDRFQGLIRKHGTSAGIYAHASVGCLHVRPVINMKTEAGVRTFEALGRATGDIRFEAVGFAYPDGHVALRDFTLAVPRGTRTAFVGRSGAGKSTVFNLLPRLYDPTAGRILLDGHDLRDLTLASLRDQIAVVSQDSVLLSATVAENIGFGRRSASRAEIEAAARAAAADGFISALPKGYDTPVIPSAAQFSGGERQRLSIARAILRDAPILLLDEPTSALDAESEAAIRAALARLAVGRTTLIIAHRLATILDADRIVVMDHGRIVEQGTHAELLTLEGLYADLYALQFAGA